jgi:hypothetical protein
MTDMQDSPTTAGSKPRKRVLTPPEKPQPKDEDSFVTPRGMDIEIRQDKIYGLYYIVFTGGGPLPRELQGKFTERSRAEFVIESYLANYWKGR